jgi:hypothetical protein
MNDSTSGQATTPTTGCAVCATPSPSEPPPFTWSAAMAGGRREWTCERCSRENIRSIEGKLDAAYW